MRKVAIVGTFVAISIMATALFASAAALDVNGKSLGAGDDSVAACDSNGISVDWVTSFVQSVLRFEISGISVGGIASACQGGEMTVVLTDTSNNVLGTITSTVGSSATQSLDLSGVTSLVASLLGHAYVVITGP